MRSPVTPLESAAVELASLVALTSVTACCPKHLGGAVSIKIHGRDSDMTKLMGYADDAAKALGLSLEWKEARYAQTGHAVYNFKRYAIVHATNKSYSR